MIAEIQRIRKPGQMFFFIDDNITSNLEEAKEFMRALIPLKIRWVSQSAINVAYDDEALRLMKESLEKPTWRFHVCTARMRHAYQFVLWMLCFTGQMALFTSIRILA